MPEKPSGGVKKAVEEAADRLGDVFDEIHAEARAREIVAAIQPFLVQPLAADEVELKQQVADILHAAPVLFKDMEDRMSERVDRVFDVFAPFLAQPEGDGVPFEAVAVYLKQVRERVEGEQGVGALLEVLFADADNRVAWSDRVERAAKALADFAFTPPDLSPSRDGWSAPDVAIDAAWRAIEELEDHPFVSRNVVALAVSVAFLAASPQPEDRGREVAGSPREQVAKKLNEAKEAIQFVLERWPKRTMSGPEKLVKANELIRQAADEVDPTVEELSPAPAQSRPSDEVSYCHVCGYIGEPELTGCPSDGAQMQRLNRERCKEVADAIEQGDVLTDDAALDFAAFLRKLASQHQGEEEQGEAGKLAAIRAEVELAEVNHQHANCCAGSFVAELRRILDSSQPQQQPICSCVGEREEAPPEPDPACPIHVEPQQHGEVEEDAERCPKCGSDDPRYVDATNKKGRPARFIWFDASILRDKDRAHWHCPDPFHVARQEHEDA